MVDESRRSSLTDRMRKARSRDVVVLQEYNTLRSKFPGIVIIAVEGDDDPIYYQTSIRAVRPDLSWVPFVCSGKDRVLALRVQLARNSDADAGKTFFVVDKDFDGLKGHEPGENLYCTPGYSIENALISISVFEELLLGEFRCSPKSVEIDSLKSLFKDRLNEFLIAIKLANKALHYCRTKRVRSGSVENQIKKYVKVTLDLVEARYDERDLTSLVGLPEDVLISQLAETEAEFEALDPMNDWRGKYILAFFVELLAQLQEDRCAAQPQKFEKKRKVSFNPRSSIVRNLSSIVRPPNCFEEFVMKISA